MPQLIVLVVSLILWILPACDQGAPPTEPAGPAGQLLVAIEGAPSDITRVVATLSRSGFTTRVLDLQIEGATRSASGTMSGLAVGVWHLVVEAFDVDDTVRFRGETDVAVVGGQTANVDLVLSEVTGSISIRVRWGQGPQWQRVYASDFGQGVGPEWNEDRLETTPSGRLFLGHFGGTEEARISLADLPAHTQVSVRLKLFVIRSWDGNQEQVGGGVVGPDIWTARVEGGPELQRTTFSNVSWLAFTQAFPGDLGSSHPYQTGASEANTLGYIWVQWPADAVYDLDYEFAHSQDTLSVIFQGGGELLRFGDESWGIESLEVWVRE